MKQEGGWLRQGWAIHTRGKGLQFRGAQGAAHELCALALDG